MSQVEKPGYKEVEIGWIPSEWLDCKLGDLAVKVGSGVTPKGGSESYLTSGVPLIRSQNVLWGRLSLSDVVFISADQHQRMANSALRPSDVLLNITGASIGRCAVLPADFGEGNVNQHVCIIRPTDSLLPGFLSQYLNSQFGQGQINKLQAGGNREGLNYQQIRGFSIALPPLPEQQKIAAILTAVDDKLDVIARQIEATQTLKQGLMQTLFNRGVGTQDADGRWVPHTQFKDSELGEIPSGWAVSRLEDAVENLDKKRIPLKQEDRASRQGAYPYYGASGIIDWIDDFLLDGDFILLGEDGENVISRNLPLAFRATGKIWVNNHAHVFAAKEGYDTLFLVELLESFDYSYLASGTAQPKITQQALRQLRFAIPPFPEQQKIGTVLESVDSKLKFLCEKQSKYQTLKRGLMQKLLTGEWRVSVDAVATGT